MLRGLLRSFVGCRAVGGRRAPRSLARQCAHGSTGSPYRTGLRSRDARRPLITACPSASDDRASSRALGVPFATLSLDEGRGRSPPSAGRARGRRVSCERRPRPVGASGRAVSARTGQANKAPAGPPHAQAARARAATPETASRGARRGHPGPAPRPDRRRASSSWPPRAAGRRPRHRAASRPGR